MIIYVAKNSCGDTVGVYKSEEEARQAVLDYDEIDTCMATLIEALNHGYSSPLTTIISKFELKETITDMITNPNVISTGDFENALDCEILSFNLDDDTPVPNNKKTGIIRRIDDLGRIVIPKEIRKTLAISDGDPFEIYTIPEEGEIVFRRYTPTENED